MTKAFSVNGADYTVEACTAISQADAGRERARQGALYVTSMKDGELFEQVVFNWDMPQSLDEFVEMCDDNSSWESSGEVLGSIKMCIRRGFDFSKKYFFPDDDHIESFFGSAMPVCVDLEELKRLAVGWGISFDELRGQTHEASRNEIAEYGVYNSEE